IQVKPYEKIYLKDIAQIIVHSPQLEDELRHFLIHKITSVDGKILVIDLMRVIRLIQQKYKQLEIESIGPAQSIVEIIYPRSTPNALLVGFVWLLLFIGSGLTIMNFHEDVSMLQVHQKIYKIITGETKENP